MVHEPTLVEQPHFFFFLQQDSSSGLMTRSELSLEKVDYEVKTVNTGMIMYLVLSIFKSVSKNIVL